MLRTAQVSRLVGVSRTGLFYLLDRLEIPAKSSGKGHERRWCFEDVLQLMVGRRLAQAGYQNSVISELLRLLREELGRRPVFGKQRAWLIFDAASGEASVFRDSGPVLIELEHLVAGGNPVTILALHIPAAQIAREIEEALIDA